MNVGLYSGAAGMRMGEEYQNMISENLSSQNVPGFKQSIPVFSTDPAVINSKTTQTTNSGNPAAVVMNRVFDFSQGAVRSSGNPYHVAIEGKAFFTVREADGTTSYTRNGEFGISKSGELQTSDGASVLGKGGSAVKIDVTKASTVTIGADGAISQDGVPKGAIGFAHFDNPSASLHAGMYGRFVAGKSSDAKQGLDKSDAVFQNSLEESNGNPVLQMSDMIQAARAYEANSKSMKAIDDTQNQLITNLGGRAS
jgi:flagellar basal body rod protein FlgG